MRIRFLLPLIVLVILGVAFGLSGCDELVTEEITETVFGTPRAEFTADKEFCCNPPCTVQFFEDTTWGRRDQRQWTFGDGGTDTAQNPIHVYDSAGSYTVTLTVTDSSIDWSDLEQKKRFIIVGQYLDSFTVDTAVGCQGLEVTFTPEWGGAIDTFIWSFGDGDTVISDTPVVSHVYDSAGTFDVSLDVTGDCGVGTYGINELITIYDCPTIALETSDTVGCVPLTLTFFDATDPFPDSVEWEFGDGRTSTDRNPTIDYQTAGIYDITLTAYLGEAVAVAVFDSFLTVSDSTQAAFTSSPLEACSSSFQQFQVRFENTSVGVLDSLHWTFGDGFVSTETDPVHAYINTGIYEVMLEAFGACGVDTTVDTVVYADTIPEYPFAVSLDTTTTAVPVDFADTISSVIVDRRWSFGDDSTVSNAPSVITYQYQAPGVYICTLTVTNPCNTVQLIDSVVVNSP